AGRGSVEKILRPAPSAPSALAVGLLAFSILVKVWMGWFYGALGRRAQSPALAAAAVDSRSDVLATSAVLAGLAVSSLFRVQLDGWLGLLVAALILRAGWEAARDTLDPLLGTPPDPAMVADIEKLILSDPQILGVHDLVVHDYGPGRRMMSVHAEVSAQCALLDIHAVIDRIERELAGQFQLEAVIHIDPVQPGDPRTRRLLALVEGLAQELDAAATVHDLRCGPEGEVSCDVVVPDYEPLTDGEVREAMERKVREREPGCVPVIGVDRSHVL
ncbi:MAG: cation diffusion facilitator family transporter, partial [Oscillospiraceae bacterium]